MISARALDRRPAHAAHRQRHAVILGAIGQQLVEIASVATDLRGRLARIGVLHRVAAQVCDLCDLLGEPAAANQGEPLYRPVTARPRRRPAGSRL